MSIISFEEGKNRKREEKEFHQCLLDSFHQAAENLRKNDTDENFNELLISMADMAQHIIFSPEAKGFEEREKEEQKRFYERYKDIFSVIPILEIGRLQHFASAMLNLVPSMFHGEWQTRFDAYADFGNFHLGEFDPVCGKLEDKYGKTQYPFQFNPMDADSLEAALKDCLTRIINLCSKRDDSNVTEILYQSARLFESGELLTDLFGEELKAREKNEER